jgi:MFS family permease
MVAALGQFKYKGGLMLITGLILGAFLVLFSMTKSIAPACLLLVFTGGGNSMMMTLINSLIMANTPQELVGRVMSLFVMTFGLMPFGVLPAGALAEAFGAPFTVMLGGSLLTVFVIALALTQPNLKKLS